MLTQGSLQYNHTILFALQYKRQGVPFCCILEIIMEMALGPVFRRTDQEAMKWMAKHTLSRAKEI
jgi:hypothetical protein